jgi:flagellar hook-associated protein 1 FlgK
MANSIFGIGVSGLNAAQAGMVTTGHNITNASTPGFSRQEIVQTSNIPQFTGSGYFGAGVQVTTVKRMYNDFMAGQVGLAQAQSSQLETYNAQVSLIDNLLGDVSAGMSPALQDFFSSVNGVAANPASVPSRQAMLSGAEELAARFQSMAQRLGEIGSGVNGMIESSVGAINSYTRQIATLNNDIALAEASTNMQPANDLRDQRDNLVVELSKEIRATVVKQTDGSYNVFIGNGQPVVVGKQNFDLTTARSMEDSQRIEVGYNTGAQVALLGSATLQGGNLGGLLAFRTETLDAAQNALGRVAIGVATTVNAQHQLGQDLNGALGGAVFADLTDISSSVLPSSGNAGTAVVSASITDASALTTSDYRLQYVSQTAVGGPPAVLWSTFSLTRASDGAAATPAFFATGTGGSITMDGITVAIPALPTSPAGTGVNDTWLIEPTRNGARDFAVALTDPAAIAAASPVRTAAAQSNQGSATIASGKVTDAVKWSDVANSKNFTINFAVSVAGVVTYDIVDNNTGPPVLSLLTGAAAATTGPYPRSYVNGGAISLSQVGVGAPPTPTFDFGAQVTVSGSPLNGDSFTISRNSGGVSDSSNAVALAGLQTTNSLGKTAAGGQPLLNFQQAYAQLVSQVGNKARQMQVTSTAQKNLLAQTKTEQQSISGVNLDDEAANLLRYQQAYQASGKMMQIATSLFQTLLDIGR